MQTAGHRRRARGAAALAGLLAAAATSAGCGGPQEATGLGSLAVTLREAEVRALVPEGDFEPSAYLVAGSGPAGAAFSVELAAAQVVVQDLAAGTWALEATARNAAGAAVASGQAAAEVCAGATREVSITISALPGRGSLELLATWEPSLAAAPAVEAELVSVAGERLALEAVADGAGRASCSAAAIAAAWYTLVVRLYDGERLVAGAAEAVLIRAGTTTRGEVRLGAGQPGAAGSVGLAVALRLPAILAIVMAGQLGVALPLQQLALETSAPATAARSWYLDGRCVASGSPVELDAPEAPGIHRIDVVSVDGERGVAGSVSHLFAVSGSVEHGTLTSNFVLSSGAGGVQGLRGARSAAVSPDGRQVYVAGYDSDSVAIFDRSTRTGLLAYRARAVDGAEGVQGLDGPDGLALSPDGRHLYVACSAADTVAAFERDPSSGALSFASALGGLDGVRSVALSPDGAFLYAALAAADAVAVLARDVEGGELTAAGLVSGGPGGVSLLVSPAELLVSPDGANLYVAAYGSDAILWFGRDPATGLLLPAGALRDGEGGAERLNGPLGLAVAPDGSSVLVASYYDRALTVLARDPLSGALSFAAASTEGLTYARDVVCAADGRTVYVSSAGGDSVAAFRLDPLARAVSYLGTTPVPDGPRGLALSPDGLSLYACSAGAGALAALRAAP